MPHHGKLICSLYLLIRCKFFIPIGSSIEKPTRYIFISIPFSIENSHQSHPEKSINLNKFK